MEIRRWRRRASICLFSSSYRKQHVSESAHPTARKMEAHEAMNLNRAGLVAALRGGYTKQGRDAVPYDSVPFVVTTEHSRSPYRAWLFFGSSLGPSSIVILGFNFFRTNARATGEVLRLPTTDRPTDTCNNHHPSWCLSSLPPHPFPRPPEAMRRISPRRYIQYNLRRNPGNGNSKINGGKSEKRTHGRATHSGIRLQLEPQVALSTCRENPIDSGR